MQKAGGIIAIIAGIFGIFAAGITLFIGGLGAVFVVDEVASKAPQLVSMSGAGVIFSFLAIIFGAVSMGAKSTTPGILLTLCAVAGCITGGMLVALFMVLALVGGVLAIIGGQRKETV